MPVDIKVNLDLGRAQRSYDQFAKKIEKPVRYGGIGAGKGSESKGKSFERGAAAGSIPTSDLSEFERGGFYNSLKSKLDAVKGIMGKRGQNQDERSDRSSVAQALSPQTSQKIQKLIVEHAEVKQIRGAALGRNFGMGGGGGMGVGWEVGKVDLMTKMGNTATSLGPFGTALSGAAVMAGFMIKMASAVGEQYMNAMTSQASTIGATGSYVGGGGKYFANADMAQAALAMAKERGQGVYGRGSNVVQELNTGQWTQFAASQGMGIQQVAESYGALTRDFAQNANELSLNTLRQYMKAANVPALKYGETVEKFGKHIQAMRQAGYGGISREGVEQMFSLVAGMNLATPERGADIIQTLDKQARQADQSTLGNILLSKHLASGMSMDEAMMAAERGLGDPKNAAILQDFMKSLDPLSRGFFAKQLGLTYTEGRGLTLENGQKAAVEAIQAGENPAIGMQNTRMETFATGELGDVARRAAELSERLHRDMLKLVQTAEPALGVIVTGLSTIEQTVSEMAGTLTQKLVTLTNELKD